MYDYTKIDKKVEGIIKIVTWYITNLDKSFIRDEIMKAYLYARDAHEWQIRLSWQYYINHPVESTIILLSLKPDIYTIQACLLHDVVEDTPKTAKDIKDNFWKEVAFLCEWMEKISKVKYRWEERNIWSLRKMFVAMADDLRVVFIKLSDRLHNMRTLKYHPNVEKRNRIALETINIYAPIADRLWLFDMKNDLDEECLKILKYNEYKNIKKWLKELADSSKDFIDNIKNEIDWCLVWKVKNYSIDYRIKSIYSIYRKLQKKWLKNINELYDLYWIRIMVQSEADCYKTLWIIHNKWIPLPKRFKDYIALPKPNWYKSLHTTVMWLLRQYREQPTEIQIKTFEMKEFSERWVAAHFEYKEKWSNVAKDIYWVNELKELTQNIGDSELVWSLKIDVFRDRIFVFTPKWDFINLPSWSTPIDFAYYLHTDLWNHITLAKVNWSVYPLDKELHNWDVVEVVIDKNKIPNPFWISFVKTLKAKSNIKSFLKKEHRDIYIERWKEIMNKYFDKANIEHFDREFSLLKILDWREYNLNERLTLLEQVWNFSTTPTNLLKKIIKSNKIKQVVQKSNSNDWVIIKEIIYDKQKIIIWWEKNISYKLWFCCRKKVPDDIVAHINNKWTVTIHKRNCTTLNTVNKERLLPAYLEWREDEKLIIDIELTFNNKIWILKDLSEIIYSMKIDIDEIFTKKISSVATMICLKIAILDYDYLIIDRIIDRLKIHFDTDLIEYNVIKMES